MCSIIAVDFDNTLTKESGDPYKCGGEQPNEEMVEYVQYLKEEQNENVIIWTARPWSHAEHIAGLCTMWGVQFNGLMCAKGGADCYLDDKAVTYNEDTDWRSGVEQTIEDPHGVH